MYKLIVVDDEQIMCDGLCNLIDWESIGFEVTGRFEDGREAVEYIEANGVDVVLADIKMTFMSGLDLARYVKERDLPAKVVLLSGHKDFDYARQAIDYDVVRYLLKPVSLGEIKTVFEAIRTDLDREYETTRDVDTERQHHAQLTELLREQFFTDLVLGALRDQTEIRRRFVLLGLSGTIDSSPCCLFDVCLQDSACLLHEDSECSASDLYDAVATLIAGSGGGISCHVFNRRHGVLHGIALTSDPACGESQEVSEDTDPRPTDLFMTVVGRYLDAAIQKVRSDLGIAADRAIGRAFRSLADLAVSTLPITPVLADTVTAGSRGIPQHHSERLLEQQRLLWTHVHDGSRESALSVFDHMMEEMRPLGLLWIQNKIATLFSELHRYVAGAGTTDQERPDEDFRCSEVLHQNGYEDLREWGRKYLTNITEKPTRDRQSSTEGVIARIKGYIDENCGHAITLHDIGDHVFLSPAYVSRIFRERTGVRFCDYLTAGRMERAKTLLADPSHRVYEVADMVGYQSVKHFFRLFKRHEGCTPMEYRDRVRA